MALYSSIHEQHSLPAAGPVDLDESEAYLPALVPAAGTNTMLINFLDVNRLPASFIDVPLIKIKVKQLSQDGKSTLFSANMEKHAKEWVS